MAEGLQDRKEKLHTLRSELAWLWWVSCIHKGKSDGRVIIMLEKTERETITRQLPSFLLGSDLN